MPHTQLNIHASINGLFPSVLMPNTQIAYLGTLQRDMCYVFEYVKGVKSYKANPFKVVAVDDDGDQFIHIPDLQVAHESGMMLVECVNRDQLNEPTTLRHLAVGKKWAEEHEHIYVEITDKELRDGHYLDNLKILWRYAGTHVPPRLIIECIAVLTKHEHGVPFASLAEHLATVCAGELGKELYPKTVLPCLCNLLFKHVLQTDLSRPIPDGSVLWLPDVFKETIYRMQWPAPALLMA